MKFHQLFVFRRWAKLPVSAVHSALTLPQNLQSLLGGINQVPRTVTSVSLPAELLHEKLLVTLDFAPPKAEIVCAAKGIVLTPRGVTNRFIWQIHCITAHFCNLMKAFTLTWILELYHTFFFQKCSSGSPLRGDLSLHFTRAHLLKNRPGAISTGNTIQNF